MLITLAKVSASLALAATSLLMLDAKIDAATAAHLPHRPCPTEDSRSCVWDAVHMGNGSGHSFWVAKGGKVHYVSHLRAHTLIWGIPQNQGRPLG